MNTSLPSSLCLGMKSVLSSLVLCLGLTQLAHADSILVGTDLTGNNQQGGILCPRATGCNSRAQQFTLFAPVEVTQIQILVSGPYYYSHPSPFTTPVTLNLGTQFPTTYGQTYWTGTELFQDPDPSPQNSAYTELLSFDNVNTILGAGTYYLQVDGGDLAWGSGGNTALATTAGVLGSSFECDPYANCSPGRTMGFSQLSAVDINGRVLTPEPSSLVLSATGLITMCGFAGYKALVSA